MRHEDGAYAFAFKRPPAGRARLASRSSVPSLVGMNRHEHRRLGVAIDKLVLRRGALESVIGGDAPLFAEGGAWAAEDGFCWSDGALDLPPSLFAGITGNFALIVHATARGLRYPLTTASPAGLRRATG